MYRPIRFTCLPGAALLLRKSIRLAIALVVIVLSMLAAATMPALAQDAVIPNALESGANSTNFPSLWFLLAAGLAMLVPAGFVLLASANLERDHAWNAALGGLAAAGLALFAYWAIGFALQFGGVGLVYPHAELRGQVWEWSPLSSEWGIGWGVAGLTGWFLSGELSTLSYTLFLAHIPWVMVAALLPVMTLRGRAPALVTLLLAVLMGGIIYPLAGNWVQGGGWLNALGRNMNLGHGFLDYGGAGTVHLVAAGFALAALTVWSTRSREVDASGEVALPPAHQPLLAVVGALLILGGNIGWNYANPLQVESVGDFGMMRGAVSASLAAAGGILFPLLYTWFVTGRSEPTMTARGFVAGVVAGLACGPFVAPGIAFVIGLVAGATVPFVTFLLDGRMRIDDRSGVVISSGIPAMIGLLLVGIFADGRAGAGWQMTGAGSYLGVNGQGVSGLLVASGYQMDFPAQLQSQVIGVVALGLWGFLAGLVICVPMGLLFHSLLHRNERPAPRPMPVGAPAMTGMPATGTAAPTLDYRNPTTTSAYAVPTPAYLEPRTPTTTNLPAVGAIPPAGPAEVRSDPAASLPGFAPSERRAPSPASYVAPATAPPPVAPSTPVADRAASQSGMKPLHVEPPTVATTGSVLSETPAVPADSNDTSWITASPQSTNVQSDISEGASTYTAPLPTSTREGYWPSSQPASAPESPVSPTSLPTEQTGMDTSTPKTEPALPVTPVPDAGTLGATYTDPLELGQSEPAPRPQTNGGAPRPNPLTRLGRQRPATLPDDTSPQSA